MKIKNATKQGYIEAEVGDGIDISSRMESHRGTVQKGLSQTLTCQGGNNVGVVVNGNAERERERENRVYVLGVYTLANVLNLWDLLTKITKV